MPAPPRLRSVAALPGGLSAHVWQGEALAQAGPAAVPTGHAALDAQLPGGGWPLDGLVEVLQAQAGQHCWQLLLPALAQVVRASPGPVVLVNPPWVPFGPALAAQGLPPERLLWVRADKPAARLWAAAQALRCAQVVAVLAWLPQAQAADLRRLHLAAQQQHRLLWVFRAPSAQHESSPARLRLQVDGNETLRVRILKRRGPPLEAPVLLAPCPARLAALLASRRGARTGPGAGQGALVQPLRPAAAGRREAHALDRTAAT